MCPITNTVVVYSSIENLLYTKWSNDRCAAIDQKWPQLRQWHKRKKQYYIELHAAVYYSRNYCVIVCFWNLLLPGAIDLLLASVPAWQASCSINCFILFVCANLSMFRCWLRCFGRCERKLFIYFRGIEVHISLALYYCYCYIFFNLIDIS